VKEFPIDRVIKQELTITSPSSFDWCAKIEDELQAEALTSFLSSSNTNSKPLPVVEYQHA
jgi:hypothetical protein